MKIVPGQESAVNSPLTNREKYLFTSAAHQTWTHKTSAKTVDHNSSGFMYM